MIRGEVPMSLGMATYRCPICGASHKEQPAHCRLCGQDMRDQALVPQTSKGARAATKTRKGTARIAMIGVLGVLAVLAVAVIFGFSGDDTFINNIRARIPGLSSTEDEGWSRLTDDGAGYSVELPDTRTEAFAPFGPSTTGRVEQWVAPIGAETDLSTSYATVALPAGQDDTVAVGELADSWAASLGGEVDRRDEVDFSGYPGQIITVDGLRLDGETASVQALVVLRDDRFYVVQSFSIYPDHPQWSRVANSFAFL